MITPPGQIAETIRASKRQLFNMARNFDGVNDNITFGSDASIDGFTTQTVALWLRRGTTGVASFLLGKDRSATNWAFAINASDKPQFIRDWSTTDGNWTGGTALTSTTDLNHIVLTYDGGSTANDPVITLNGTDETITEVATPAGSLNSDATPTLYCGEAGSGAGDLTGDIEFLAYANALWTAAQKNRHRWWGAVGGGVAVSHPFMTEKLTNEGTATADGTATGTTMSSLPRVERCWGSMMGCGR